MFELRTGKQSYDQILQKMRPRSRFAPGLVPGLEMAFKDPFVDIYLGHDLFFRDELAASQDTAAV